MTDISLVWIPALARCDWVMSGPDLQQGDDLETAILISLFTDRVASPDFVPPAPADPKNRRGWWGDSYTPTPTGSRLWQLDRAEISDRGAILNRARDYAAEALQWMINDGVVASFVIIAQFQNLNFLALSITARMPDGTSRTFRYSWAWKQI